MNGVSDEPRAGDARIRTLLQQAGRRTDPSPRVMRDVGSIVHAEWRAMVASRTRIRRYLPLLILAKLACVALIAATAVRWVDARGESSVTIENIRGVLQTGSDGQDAWVPGRAGQRLALGENLRTDDGSRANLNFDHGLTVQLGADTTLRLESRHSLRLQDGTLLVWVPAHADAILIQTGAGILRSGSSYYELRAHGQEVEVSVREGRVEILNESGTNWAGAGERMVVNALGEVHRSHALMLDPG